MTLTLTRERRKKFEAIIQASDVYHYALSHLENLGQGQHAEQMVKNLANKLADAAESRSEVRGIEWAMVGNRKVTESDLPGVEEEALKAFERDLQCPGSWNWYPAKASEESTWKALRAFVVKLYQTDPKAFEKYYTWARHPMSRGAKLPIHIRQDPTCFEYAWQAYQAANPPVVSDTKPAGRTIGT